MPVGPLDRRAIGDEGDGYLHCGYPNCGAQVPGTEWQKAFKEGWFFSRDGMTVLCPRHLTPGIIEWRARKKAKQAEAPHKPKPKTKPSEPRMVSTWSGDDEVVRGTFPDLRRNRNRHEHWDELEGGYFVHVHNGGMVPHGHGPRGGVIVIREPKAAPGQ